MSDTTQPEWGPAAISLLALLAFPGLFDSSSWSKRRWAAFYRMAHVESLLRPSRVDRMIAGVRAEASGDAEAVRRWQSEGGR